MINGVGVLDILDSIEEIEDIINSNEMVLVYFGNNLWGVCKDLMPKVLALLENYPKVKTIYVDGEKSHNTSVRYNIFTFPGIIVYVDGKESIREAKHISIRDIESRIDRYYNLLF